MTLGKNSNIFLIYAYSIYFRMVPLSNSWCVSCSTSAEDDRQLRDDSGICRSFLGFMGALFRRPEVQYL